MVLHGCVILARGIRARDLLNLLFDDGVEHCLLRRMDPARPVAVTDTRAASAGVRPPRISGCNLLPWFELFVFVHG